MVLKMSTRKSYSEMIKFETAEERFDYLKCDGFVSDATFGGSRYLNQLLYESKPWKKARKEAILRDNGCDMAVEGREISEWDKLVVHHINPITVDDVLNRSSDIFDLENLVCVSDNTHRMIHYGDASGLHGRDPVVRYPNDTCPWK